MSPSCFRGLKEEDFTVRLNGSRREIYSLDNLCQAKASPSKAAGGPPREGPAAGEKPFRLFLHHVHWNRGSDREPATAELSFEIREKS